MALVRILLRHDTAENWYNINPRLAAGEAGVETDTGKIKVGNGVNFWRQLAYTDGELSDDTPNPIGIASSGNSSKASRSDHTHALPSAGSFNTLLVQQTAQVAGSLTVSGNLIGGSHAHSTSDITGLDSALAARSLSTHDHFISDIVNFPNQTGNANKFLTTDGATLVWGEATGGSGSSYVVAGDGITVTTESDGDQKVSLAAPGVQTLNGASGQVVIAAGSNVSVSESNGTITISASTSSTGTAGVSSVNSVSGAVSIVAGTNLTASVSGQNITLDVDSHNHTHSEITDFGAGVNAKLAAGDNITLSFDATTGVTTLSADETAPTFPDPDPTDPPSPDITQDLPPNTLSVNGGLTLQIEVANASNPSFEWQYKDYADSSWTTVVNDSVHSGVTTNKLELTGVTGDIHDRLYRVFVTTGSDVLQSAETRILSRSLVISEQAPGGIIVDQADLEVEAATTMRYEGSKTGLVYYKFIELDMPAGQTHDFGGEGYPRGSISPTRQDWSLSNSPDGYIYLAELERAVTAGIDFDEAGIVGAGHYDVFIQALIYDYNPAQYMNAPAGAEEIRSDVIRLRIQKGSPAIVTQPQDTALWPQNSSSGSTPAITFSCEVEYAAPIVWWHAKLDGTMTPVDLTAGNGSWNTETKTAGTGDNVISTLTITNAHLQGITAGDRFYAMIGDGIIAPKRQTTRAQVLGSPPTINEQTKLVGGNAIIAGSNAQFTVKYAPPTATVYWEYRPDDDTDWAAVTTGVSTGSGLSTLTISNVTESMDGYQYKARIETTTNGYRYSDPAQLSVVGIVDPGSNVFNTQLPDAQIDENGGYFGIAKSTLLSTTDHYAVCVVEYDNGTREFVPLKNGSSNSQAEQPLKYFAAGAYSEYQVEVINIPRACSVSVHVATDPHQINLATNPRTSSPFYRSTPYCSHRKIGFRGSKLRTDQIADQSIQQSCLDSSSNTGNVTVSFPYPLVGFSESRKARIAILPQRPYLAPLWPEGQDGVFIKPESYFYLGAANLADEVLAVPRGLKYSTVIFSENGGLDWSTYLLPKSIKANAVIWWKNYWYIFYYDEQLGYHTAIRSSNPKQSSWTRLNWNFGGFDYQNACFASVSFSQYDVYQSTDMSVNANTSYDTHGIGLSASVVDDILYVACPGQKDVMFHSWLRRKVPQHKMFRIAGATSQPTVSVSNFYFGHTTKVNGDATTTATKIISGVNVGTVTSTGVTWSALREFAESESMEISSTRNPIYANPVSVPNQSQKYTITMGYPFYRQNGYFSTVSQGSNVNFGFTPQGSEFTSGVSTLSSLSADYQALGHSGFMGPQIGSHVYGCAAKSDGNYHLVRFNALFPQQATSLQQLNNYGSSKSAVGDYYSRLGVRGSELPSHSWDFANASTIYRGSYRYGTTDQLHDNYLNGRNTPSNGTVIFTKNRMVVIFRYHTGTEPRRTSRTGGNDGIVYISPRR